jgi:hypothetical protein
MGWVCIESDGAFHCLILHSKFFTLYFMYVMRTECICLISIYIKMYCLSCCYNSTVESRILIIIMQMIYQAITVPSC